MADPQVEHGYVRVANELWDEILSRSFTKHQRNILNLIIRLSYGCNKVIAIIPRKRDFELAGIYECDIEKELAALEKAKVIKRSRGREYQLQKDYTVWQISRQRCKNILNPESRLAELVAMNLTEPDTSKRGKQKKMFDEKKTKGTKKERDVTTVGGQALEFGKFLQDTLVCFFNVNDPRFDKQIETIVKAIGLNEAIREAKIIIGRYRDTHGSQPHYSYVIQDIVNIAGRKAALEVDTKEPSDIEDDELNPFKGGVDATEE